jgi:hypothetical protein
VRRTSYWRAAVAREVEIYLVLLGLSIERTYYLRALFPMLWRRLKPAQLDLAQHCVTDLLPRRCVKQTCSVQLAKVEFVFSTESPRLHLFCAKTTVWRPNEFRKSNLRYAPLRFTRSSQSPSFWELTIR